jgi:membrane protein DedA with SNARE-associated domain
MELLLTTLLSYLLLYKYVAVFVIVFLSGLLLPFPANTLMLAAGAFASQGYLSGSLALGVAVVANVLGDSLGYSLTRLWGTRLITEAHLKRFKTVDRVEKFVRQNTRLTIFVTRFFGSAGVAVNFLAGLSGVAYRRFVTYDILGNFVDLGCFVVAGYFLGVYSDNYSDIALLTGWIIFIAIAIFLIFRLFWRKSGNK